jgi:hypothetical protein
MEVPLMPRSNGVRLLVENRPEEKIAEAIFRREVESGLVEVDSGLTTSGTIALAELSLLEHPDRPVALVLNTRTENQEKIAELHETVPRILSRTAPPDRWQVALAVPRLDAWAWVDPRLRAALEAREVLNKDYSRLADELVKLTRKHPFDVEALAQASPDFRGLLDFIQRHAQAARPSGAASR